MDRIIGTPAAAAARAIASSPSGCASACVGHRGDRDRHRDRAPRASSSRGRPRRRRPAPAVAGVAVARPRRSRRASARPTPRRPRSRRRPGPSRRGRAARSPPARPCGRARPASVDHPMISRFARLASIFLRPTAGSLKATVTSSSLRVSLEVTTIPSPHRPWRTRSPSRNWRSPGMTGRAGRRGRGRPGAASTVDVVVPRADRSRERARRARRRRRPRASPRGRATAGTSHRPPARPAGRSPAGTPGPPPRVGVPNRRRAPRPEDEVEVEVPVVAAGAELRPDHELGRDLEQEPRRHGRLAHPPGRPAPGVRQVQPPLGPGDARRTRAGAPPRARFSSSSARLCGKRPSSRPGDEDDRELEALGGVERDQRDRVGVALVRILVGDERGLLEQPVERVVGRQVVVAGRDRAQLEQVRPALLAVLGAVGEHRPVAGCLEDLVEQLGERPARRPGPAAAGRGPRSRPGRSGPAARARRARRSPPPRSRPRSYPPSRAAARAQRPRSSCRRCRAPGR